MEWNLQNIFRHGHKYQVEHFQTYAMVTPLCKAALYEPHIAMLGIWGDMWLTRGKYGIYVVVTGPLQGIRDTCYVKSALSTVVSPTWQ